MVLVMVPVETEDVVAAAISVQVELSGEDCHCTVAQTGIEATLTVVEPDKQNEDTAAEAVMDVGNTETVEVAKLVQPVEVLLLFNVIKLAAPVADLKYTVEGLPVPVYATVAAASVNKYVLGVQV